MSKLIQSREKENQSCQKCRENVQLMKERDELVGRDSYLWQLSSSSMRIPFFKTEKKKPKTPVND